MHRGLASLGLVNQLPPADALPGGAHGRRSGLALRAVREALADDQVDERGDIHTHTALSVCHSYQRDCFKPHGGAAGRG